MPTRFVIHTTLLLLSVTGVYFWVLTPTLASFNLQLVALLLLAYASLHWFHKKESQVPRRQSVTFDLTVLTSVLLLLVADTGALGSPFFFLLYFLLFAVALLYEIEATLVLTGTLLLFFVFFPGSDFSSVAHLSQIAALVMITPLAIFTAHQVEQAHYYRLTSAQLTQNLSSEETDILIFLSLNLKRTLTSSLETISQLIPKMSLQDSRQNLERLYQDLRTLHRSADELQQLVDRETDQK